MQWVLSTILGLLIAWVILAFVGPVQPRVSYYVQQPVSPTPLSDLDKIMGAVGLRPSQSPAPSPVSVAIMTVPEPPKSVADIAQSSKSEVHVDQGTVPTPHSPSPAPGPAPAPL